MAPSITPRSAAALVIGIGSYPNAGARVTPLPYAVRDAEELANALRDPHLGGFPSDSVRLLPEAEASKDRIQAEFTVHLFEAARDKDLVLIYLSGHGMLIPGNPPQGYFIPRAGRPAERGASRCRGTGRPWMQPG